jgi:hypothetical protein
MKHFKELLTLIPFVIGIAVLLNLFVYQGMEVIYPSPIYEDYCGNSYDRMVEPSRVTIDGQPINYTPAEITEFENQCVAVGGRYEESFEPGQLGYCDQNYTCNLEREADEKSRALVMLIVLTIGGAASLIASKQFKNKAVELGFSYGGLFMLLSTLGQLWRVGSQAVQLVGIVLALAAVVYFANRSLKDEN